MPDSSDFQAAYTNGASITDPSVSWAWLAIPDTYEADSDSSAAFLWGEDLVDDNQLAYTKGQDTASDNQTAYLVGGITADDSTPAYTDGFFAEPDPSVSWGWLAIPDTYESVDTFTTAYLFGQAVVLDSTEAFLSGKNTSSDSQSAFLAGGIEASDSQIAYLKGGVATSSSIFAFVQAGEASSISAFMQGEQEAEDGIEAYIKGEDIAAGSKSAFAQGSLDTSDAQSAYLEGVAEASSMPAYLKGSVVASDGQSAYLTGNLQNTIDVQISADIDDSYTYDGVAVDGENKVLCNENDATTLFSGLRFRNLPIPEQVTIVSAYISLFTYIASYWTPEFTLYGEDTNAPTAPEGGTLLDDRTLTTASKLWSEGIIAGWNDSPDLSEVVQEVVDLPAWSAGDDICIIGEDTQSSKKYAGWDYQGDTAKATKLHIEYIVGVSDNQSAFTRGQDSQSSSQSAFLFGAATSSVPAFLDGYPATPVDDSQSAYLVGQSRFVSAFTIGGGPWPFTDDFTGSDEDLWDTDKWISTEEL